MPVVVTFAAHGAFKLILRNNLMIRVATVLTASVRMHNKPLAWPFIVDGHIECTAY